MSYVNEFASLTHHKDSKRGKIIDFVIRFHEKQQDIELIVVQAFQVFDQLMQHYFTEGKSVKARLIAKVRYKHFNPHHEREESSRIYFFPSYQSDVVEDTEEFFTFHLMKIASRMDNFHTNGSNLVLDYIENIHVEVSILN